ncbi:chloride channel protein [Actinomyces polynesiensis]|uniref:chloride channel protein n=1 Tax=Actinomyces polynesiensis TaxID=1325934 RepID=UPI0006944E94|nr:chloride channel protein [Actinomyces polynesiensis]
MDPAGEARTPALRFLSAVLLSGLTAGATGWFFVRLLHLLEHLAYGLGEGTFLAAVVSTDPRRRVAVLALAGLIGGVSWFLIRRHGRGIVSVTDAVAGWRMPLVTTFLHSTTQVVIVGLGASIGREVAPREMSAALSGALADRLGLTAADRRTVVACGAGAGLAAVYSIPLSGAVFALEVLLVNLGPRSVWPALATSGVAVLVADGWQRPEPFYTVPDLRATASLLVWAVVMGPFLGALGHLFHRAVRRFEVDRPTGASLLLTMPLGFTVVGLVSVWVPSVLGNGQSTAQTAFDATALAPLVVVVLARAVATLLTIRSGAWGGTLTPGIALGAGLGALSGLAWSMMWPGTQVAAFALIGAATFLGTSMRAPFTALVLVLELTQQGVQVLVPALLALAGAVAASAWVEGRLSAPSARRGSR